MRRSWNPKSPHIWLRQQPEFTPAAALPHLAEGDYYKPATTSWRSFNASSTCRSTRPSISRSRL